MVLVGKLNSEIVQRLNRHGQSAVGLAGEDGTLFEVAPVAQRRPGRLRRLDRAGRRRRLEPHRRRLHPGGRLLGLLARGPVLQRQRRRGRRQGGGGARRLQGDLPHRRRGLARRRRGPRARWSRRPRSPRSRRRSSGSRAGCGRSSRPASTRSAAAPQSAHIIDGRVPHSLLLELFTKAGVGTMVTP